jgi:hypothetical protein
MDKLKHGINNKDITELMTMPYHVSYQVVHITSKIAIASCLSLVYICYMIIEQTIEIPADYRIFLELPRSVPTGVKVKVKIDIPASDRIDEIRHLLQKEMEQNETVAIPSTTGDGWEVHVKENYAEP